MVYRKILFYVNNYVIPKIFLHSIHIRGSIKNKFFYQRCLIELLLSIKDDELVNVEK